MSSRKAVTGKVGELSNESGVQTEESSSRSLIYIRKTWKPYIFPRASPDGRYLFYINCWSVEVIDTLFKKKTIFNFDSSTATIDGQPLKGCFAVEDYYAFDLENSLILTSSVYKGYCVAIGVVNLEQSTVVIGQSTAISFRNLRLQKSRFIPKFYPANLKDGFILKVADNGRSECFDIKLDDQDQLQVTKINWLSNVNVVAVDGQFAYSLDWQPIDDGTQQNGQYVELSKRSLGTGELSSYPTMNSEAMGKLAFESGCRVENQFFGYTRNYSTNKSQIVSLNLNTLEWKETGMKLNGHVEQMTTDGERDLIVFTEEDLYGNVYRFVVNKPYSLSTCVWRNLQSIMNARPDVYKFIRSKLPTNFRSPRPIKHSVPFDFLT